MFLYRKEGGWELEEKQPPTLQRPEPEDLNQTLKEFFGANEKEVKKFKTAIGKA